MKDKCGYRFDYNEPICRHPESKISSKCFYEAETCPKLNKANNTDCDHSLVRAYVVYRCVKCGEEVKVFE